MIRALALLLLCQLAGEAIVRAAGVTAHGIDMGLNGALTALFFSALALLLW